MHTRVARAYEFADLSDYSFAERLKIRAADLVFFLLINLIGLTARFEVTKRQRRTAVCRFTSSGMTGFF